MGSRKNSAFVIAIISTLTLATGCGITITRNHYYAYPDQSVKKSNKKEAQINGFVNTPIDNKNGRN
ncbi:hypothetical protein SAMN04487894_11390 [Niabella drilacis]|uniref:Uncharacterized protein n=1 Tax=Niabella drilacis (strain DSM 25811 / CCM 8410 / CCUG 62505 / LMG 26954 / E90) TaxID=1285928 RepID=A0A1G6XL26_NIADE|nr:hypothetical protein SAMN04487894_11390 [Niabella drilacis]